MFAVTRSIGYKWIDPAANIVAENPRLAEQMTLLRAISCVNPFGWIIALC